MRRISTPYVAAPARKASGMITTSAAGGVRPNHWFAKTIAYMPSIMYSAWAKLMTSITPQMSPRPSATSAYTRPITRPPIAAARKRSTAPLSRRPGAVRAGPSTVLYRCVRLALVPRGRRPHDGGLREIEGPDDLVCGVENLHHHAAGLLVLPVLVELDAPRHDRIACGHVRRQQSLQDQRRRSPPAPVDRVRQRKE